VKMLQKYPLLRCHIVHLSAHSAIPIIRHARQVLKLPLTVETCFHYLTLVSDGEPSSLERITSGTDPRVCAV
jgi:allantoinase